MTAEANPLSEAELFRRLASSIETGEVVLSVDRSKLDNIDFPLGIEADGNHWAFPLLFIAGGIWWYFGLIPGLVAMATAFAIYQTAGRRYVAHRLRRRILDTGLADLDTWRKLWRFGGVILTAPRIDARFQGPTMQWAELVRALEADSITRA